MLLLSFVKTLGIFFRALAVFVVLSRTDSGLFFDMLYQQSNKVF